MWKHFPFKNVLKMREHLLTILVINHIFYQYVDAFSFFAI